MCLHFLSCSVDSALTPAGRFLQTRDRVPKEGKALLLRMFRGWLRAGPGRAPKQLPDGSVLYFYFCLVSSDPLAHRGGEPGLVPSRPSVSRKSGSLENTSGAAFAFRWTDLSQRSASSRGGGHGVPAAGVSQPGLVRLPRNEQEEGRRAGPRRVPGSRDVGTGTDACSLSAAGAPGRW